VGALGDRGDGQYGGVAVEATVELEHDLGTVRN
jgi:hypothetical protein